MSSELPKKSRIVSGMRVTGRLHLGNYHGALKNWLKLQDRYDCFFFAADWHALTTHYEDLGDVSGQTIAMMSDWLAAGLDPERCCMFIQSWVPEHAELHLLLSMVTPLAWLERVPTYKDQQEKLKEKNLATYGFLGYPLLQAADILIYRPIGVPVGEDQAAHVEITREVARRFNFMFGREQNFAELVEQAIGRLGKKNAKLFRGFYKTYQEAGDLEALRQAQTLLSQAGSISTDDRERLQGYLEGTGKQILTEPELLLSETPKYPGLDGQKMSKSYGNTIQLSDSADEVNQKVRTMPTDPQRVRRTDPGDPEKCPVWAFHQIYSNDEVKQWVQKGCTTAGIGCIECKAHISEAINAELTPIRERSAQYDPTVVKNVVVEGSKRAREVARQTIQDVNQAIGLATQ